MEIEKLVEELKPALERIKTLRGTMASAAAEQLLGEANHGFIPVIDENGVIIVTKRSSKSPAPVCEWCSGTSGLRIFNGMVEAYASITHWICLDKNGDVTEADPHFFDPEFCCFWNGQSEFNSD